MFAYVFVILKSLRKITHLFFCFTMLYHWFQVNVRLHFCDPNSFAEYNTSVTSLCNITARWQRTKHCIKLNVTLAIYPWAIFHCSMYMICLLSADVEQVKSLTSVNSLWPRVVIRRERNKLSLTYILIREYVFENIICKISAILV